MSRYYGKLIYGLGKICKTNGFRCPKDKVCKDFYINFIGDLPKHDDDPLLIIV